MERDVEQIKRDLSDLLRKWEVFQREWVEIREKVKNIEEEIGVKRGDNLSEQFDALQKSTSSSLETHKDMVRRLHEIQLTNKKLEANNVEIMKALSLIYKSVDELEPELISDSSNQQ